MTHSHVTWLILMWHAAFAWMHMTRHIQNPYMWHDPLIVSVYFTCHFQIMWHAHSHVTWLILIRACDMTHSDANIWHDSFILYLRLHLQIMWHDSFSRDMTRSHSCMWYDTFRCKHVTWIIRLILKISSSDFVTWLILIYACDMTHFNSHMWQDSFMWHDPFIWHDSFMWHDSFIWHDLLCDCTWDQHTAPHCTTQWHTVTHCNMLSHVTWLIHVTWPIHVTWLMHATWLIFMHTCDMTHSYVVYVRSTHCITPHHTVTHCDTLWRTATYCHIWHDSCILYLRSHTNHESYGLQGGQGV